MNDLDIEKNNFNWVLGEMYSMAMQMSFFK